VVTRLVCFLSSVFTDELIPKTKQISHVTASPIVIATVSFRLVFIDSLTVSKAHGLCDLLDSIVEDLYSDADNESDTSDGKSDDLAGSF
jgi:hypothetical protein